MRISQENEDKRATSWMLCRPFSYKCKRRIFIRFLAFSLPTFCDDIRVGRKYNWLSINNSIVSSRMSETLSSKRWNEKQLECRSFESPFLYGVNKHIHLPSVGLWSRWMDGWWYGMSRALSSSNVQVPHNHWWWVHTQDAWMQKQSFERCQSASFLH